MCCFQIPLSSLFRCPTMSGGGDPSCRQATHAGSWYTSDGRQLRAELDGWLNAVGGASRGPARAIIGPHAGYRYCGACAAYAYRQIDPTPVKRVFILGPSHHVRLGGCAVSACSRYQTPLYDLTIDKGINEELLSTGEFEVMTLEADEDEHSIEMHLPYVARVMESKRDAFTIVPVLVGSLSQARPKTSRTVAFGQKSNKSSVFRKKR